MPELGRVNGCLSAHLLYTETIWPGIKGSGHYSWPMVPRSHFVLAKYLILSDAYEDRNTT